MPRGNHSPPGNPNPTKVDPGPPARGQPLSGGHAVGMPQVLPRHVRAGGSYMVPRQRLDEIPAGPLKNRAPDEVDTASRLGLRVANERYQASIRPKTRDDMHMVRENGELLNMHVPASRCFANRGPHDIGVGAPDPALS